MENLELLAGQINFYLTPFLKVVLVIVCVVSFLVMLVRAINWVKHREQKRLKQLHLDNKIAESNALFSGMIEDAQKPTVVRGNVPLINFGTPLGAFTGFEKDPIDKLKDEYEKFNETNGAYEDEI